MVERIRAIPEADENLNQERGDLEARSTSLSGSVVMNITLAGDGSVASVQRKAGTFNDALTEQCFASTFLTLKFPPPQANPAGAIVTLIVGSPTP